ncbi:ceramidase [Pyronema domesticum]|nr:ceramidase [Pyronema domesticum]
MYWPYPIGEQVSHWGPVTSTVNFCEQDYYVTPYIAEFINTLSNFLYIVLAAYGISKSPSRDKVVLWSYGLMGFVGVGSTLFHGSLKFSTQMMDELGMVYATATALYSILTIDLRQWSRWLAMFLFTSMAMLTVVHCNATEPSIQRLCFTTMIYGTFIRCYMLIKRVKDERVRKEMKTIAKVGTGFYITGTLIWMFDEMRCQDLKNIRDVVGLPWGLVFEAHGWWHVLTAVGVYCYLVFVEYLRLALYSTHPLSTMRVAWRLNFFPHLELISNDPRKRI